MRGQNAHRAGSGSFEALWFLQQQCQKSLKRAVICESNLAHSVRYLHYMFACRPSGLRFAFGPESHVYMEHM